MSDLISQASYPVYLFFLIVSIFSFFLGAGVALRIQAVLHFIEMMNRWVSLRRMTKVFAVPHYIDSALLKWPALTGALVVIGGAVSVYVLGNLEAGAFRILLPGSVMPDLAIILAQSIKWFLVAGNAFSVVMGILMLVSPRQVPVIESYTDHWYSARKQTLPLEKMHMEIDNWFLKHPVGAGIALTILSLGDGVSMFTRL